MNVDKAYYSEYDGCGVQDQCIASVKSAIQRGINRNLHLKCNLDFSKFISEALKNRVNRKTIDRRIVYCVDVFEIKRLEKKNVKVATGIKKTYFDQFQPAGLHGKSTSRMSKDFEKSNPCLFGTFLCVCKNCSIKRDITKCENIKDASIINRILL